MKKLYIFLLSTLLAPMLRATTYPKKMIITEPVVNLRYQPQATPHDLTLPASPADNPLQASQLLLGEYVIAHKEFTDHNFITWLKVDTIQQEDPDQLYPGWIQAGQALEVDTFPEYNLVVQSYLATVTDQNNNNLMTLSIGTRLQGITIIDDQWQILLPDQRTAYIHISDLYEIKPTLTESIQELRNKVVQTSKKFLNDYYSWGGRSAQDIELFGNSGADCSGMLGLSFLTCGLQIPRMSHEQLLGCSIINYGKDLQPGDFIFTSFQNRYRYPMDHVMMYIGDDMLIESTMAGNQQVRIISCSERFGTSTQHLHSGDMIYMRGEPCEIYFGTFFDQEMLQRLRDHARMTEYEIVMRKY